MAKEDSDKRAGARRELLLRYKRVFGSEDGKKVLYDLMKECGMLKSSFPNNGDVNETLYREGKREVVLRICRLVKMDVNQLDKLIEQQEQESMFYE